jgi:hypothetical protein
MVMNGIWQVVLVSLIWAPMLMLTWRATREDRKSDNSVAPGPRVPQSPEVVHFEHLMNSVDRGTMGDDSAALPQGIGWDRIGDP